MMPNSLHLLLLLALLFASCGQDDGGAPIPLLQSQENISDICYSLNSEFLTFIISANGSKEKTYSGKFKSGEKIVVTTEVSRPGSCNIVVNTQDPELFFDFSSHSSSSVSDSVKIPSGGASGLSIRVNCTSSETDIWDISFECE